MEKGIRYYWVDSNAGPKQDFFRVFDKNARYSGIGPPSVRKLIIKADRLGIIPNNKEQALTIEQIKSKLRRKNN